MPKSRFSFAYDMRMEAESETAEILLYGNITQHKYSEDEMTAKDFDTLLKDAKKRGAKRVCMRINSPGGSVYQAIAMRTMLATAGFDELSVRIEGMCASAATLMVCIPGVKAEIAEGSSFMIHNPWTFAMGNANELEHEAETLRKMEGDFRGMYAARTGKTEELIRDWMDAETWFTAKEAVENGFCDSVLDVSEAAACVTDEVYSLMRDTYDHVPEMAHNTELNAAAEADAAAAFDYTNNEEDTTMEISEITMDMLRSGNSALYEQILQAGAAGERQRMSTIDSLTLPGYEDMAQQAKDDGTSAAEFIMKMAAAQKAKGKAFREARAQETAPADKVTGGDAQDNDGKDMQAKADEFAKEAAALAREMRSGNAVNEMF